MERLAPYLVRNTKFITEIDKRNLTRSWRAFHDLVNGFRHMDFERLTIDMCIDKGLGTIDLTNIFQQAELLPEDPDELLSSYRNALREYEYEIWKKEANTKLKMATKHINSNEINQAMRLVHSIKGYSNVSLMTVKETLFDSLNCDITFMSGVHAIDKVVHGFSFGNITSLIGASGSQKTRFSIWLLISILRNNPTFKALYFEKEMRAEDVLRMIASFLSETDVRTVFNKPEDERLETEDRKVSEITLKIRQKFDNSDIYDRIMIVPNNKFHNAVDIARIVEEYEPNVFVLDYMTMLSGDKSDGYAFMSEQAEMIKDLVNNTNTWALIINQLKLNTVSARNNKIPLTSDIEYGSKIEQFSSDVLSIFYPYKYYSTLDIDSYRMDKKWFYLVGSKFRYAQPSSLVLSSSPGIVRYNELPPDEEEYALKWLEKYKSRYR